ncbi:MAG: AsmA family protein, partial [Methyloceanibacter sp.]
AVLIMVLGALFAAPFFIDWNDYRPLFETQASKLFGREVKVGGKVHLVLLPAPELRFGDVRVADAQGGFDKPLLEARSIEAWLNIGALLRGGIEARKITIIDPVLRLALGPDGTGNWRDVGRTGAGLPFVPSEVALDEVSLIGGRIEMAQPGQSAIVLEQVEGEASAASLSGPYKLSVTYHFEGRPQELRLSTSASDADGQFRLKSALRDPDRGTVYLLDGDVNGLRETPSYAGAFVMRIAPSLPTEEQAAAQTPEPSAPAPLMPEDPLETNVAAIPGSQLSAFELKGELNATPGHAELPNFEIAIHTKGRSQMMKGKLALDFGAKAKAVAELGARWVDVDTLLAASAPAKGQAPTSAVGVLSAMAERALKQAALVEEGALVVRLEQASIGGDLVGGVDLALSARDGAVTIDRLKGELPGENRIEASGRLIQSEGGPVFAGPVKLEGSKFRTLVRWAAGDREMSGQAAVGAFTLAATATIGGGDLKLDQANGELSGTKFSGALHYRGGEQRLVDLVLDSDRLDLREVMGENAAWRSWLPAAATKQKDGAPQPDLLTSLRHDELHVAMRVGELLLPDVPPGRLDAKFSLARDTLDVERLDFDAQGAIALNGNGRIERLSGAPSGQVDFSLRAATPEGLRVASELLGLSEGAAKSTQFAGLVPLDLEIGLNAARQGNATDATLKVQGKAGGADISLLAKARGEPAKLAEAEIDLTGTIAGDRAHALLGLLAPSLTPERLAAVAGADPGSFAIKAHGVPKSGVTGRMELSTASLQAAFEGEGSLQPDGITLVGQASAKSGDASLALLLLGLESSPSAAGVPLDLRASIAKTGPIVDFSDISGQAADEAVRGSAHFDLSGDKTRFSLSAKLTSVSLPSLLGSLVAWQRTPTTEEVLGTIAHAASGVWPPRGFALDPLAAAEGEIKLEAQTLTLGAPFQLEQAVLLARIDEEGLSITDLQGRLFGGSFAAWGVLAPKGSGAQL